MHVIVDKLLLLYGRCEMFDNLTLYKQVCVHIKILLVLYE